MQAQECNNDLKYHMIHRVTDVMSDLHWVWAIGWQGGGGGSSEPGGIISEKALVQGY